MSLVNMQDEKLVLVIVGPTAVGKTAFAIEVAKRLNTEIISADSRQCFKELNIGVAKPSELELHEVKHHFISSHSIHEEVNAAVFEQYALKAAAEIFKSNNIAVMVGGTGLYVKAFCEGLDDIPEVDANIRKDITSKFEEKGMAWLQNEVLEKDPEFWKNAEQHNPQRLMRALEVKEATGKSIMHFRNGDKQDRSFRIIKIGLELPREELYYRINTRVDHMMLQGLLEEVKSLLPEKRLNALQTVGYKEIFQFLDGLISLETAIEDVKKNSRHYAKRQLTWFKKDGSIKWVSSKTIVKDVIDEVLTY